MRWTSPRRPTWRARAPRSCKGRDARQEPRRTRRRRALQGGLQHGAPPRIGFELGARTDAGQPRRSARGVHGGRSIACRKNESAEAKKARDDARAGADDLDARIPELTIRLTGDGQISVDGEPLRRDALAVPRKLNPAARRPGPPRRRGALAEARRSPRGDKKSIDLETPSSKPRPPAPSGDGTRGRLRAARLVPPGQHEKPNPARTVAFTIMASPPALGPRGIYAIIDVSTAKKDCDASNICNSDFRLRQVKAMTMSIVADVLFGTAIVSGSSPDHPRMIKTMVPKWASRRCPRRIPLRGREVLTMRGKAIFTRRRSRWSRAHRVLHDYASTSSGLGDGNGGTPGSTLTTAAATSSRTSAPAAPASKERRHLRQQPLSIEQQRVRALRHGGLRQGSQRHELRLQHVLPAVGRGHLHVEYEPAWSNIRCPPQGLRRRLQYAFLTYSGAAARRSRSSARPTAAPASRRSAAPPGACFKNSDSTRPRSRPAQPTRTNA